MDPNFPLSILVYFHYFWPEINWKLLFFSKPDEDTKENSIANDTFEENIQIEIEPVDDKEEEDNLNESLKSAENSVDVN